MATNGNGPSQSAPFGTGDGTSRNTDVDWLWESLLQSRHTHRIVTSLAPDDFDWNGVHPVHGTPLMAVVNEVVRSGVVDSQVRSLLEWCFKLGADPRKVAPAAKGYSGGWGNNTDEFPHVPRVQHVGKSAITLVLGLVKVLERITVYEHKGKYREQLSAAKELLDFFGNRSLMRSPSLDLERRARDTQLKIWSDIQHDTERSDVSLQIQGENPADPPTVFHAHSLVLINASRVLRALLFSPMVEGTSHVVNLHDTSPVAVDLVLQMIYTGTLPEEFVFQRPGAGFYQPGDLVEVNYRGQGQWWPGKVVHVDASEGSVDVNFDGDGGWWEERVFLCNLRRLRASSEQTEEEIKAKNEKVVALIAALDLAHRWDVPHVGDMLEKSICDILRHSTPNGAWRTKEQLDQDVDLAKHFEHICDAALRQNLRYLRSCCQAFAVESGEVRAMFERGAFGERVTQELQRMFH